MDSQINNNITENILSNWAMHTKEAVICLSLDFHILEFNPVAEKIFGKNKKDITKQCYLSLCESIGTTPPFTNYNVSQMLSGKILTDVETTFNASNAMSFIFSWTTLCSFDANNTAYGFMLVGNDITQLRQAEAAIEISEHNKHEELKAEKERAEAANLAKSEFLAVVIHELRTPLTSILGMTQLLNSKNLEPAKQKEYLQHILSAGRHLLSLINDTLDLAKLEAAKIQVAAAPLNLKELIEETNIILTPLAKAKNLELFIHFDQAAPHNIVGDQRLLRQIIINLIGNAIKFTDHGHVSISVECITKTEDVATIAISVSDTGIGVPEEKQGMIFELFSQVDAANSRSYSGTGLGLTITKQLVELMSGTINVTSQPGKGTTFRCVIEFPLQQESIVQYPWLQYESEVRILIVDDTPTGHVLQKQLSASNSQVVSGSQAFSALLAAYQSSEPYKLVIFDQSLETVAPFALAESIQQHKELYQPMLFLLLDDGSTKTKEVAKAAGFFECITKPTQAFSLQVSLAAAWERWIEQRAIKSLHVPIKKIKVLLVEDNEIVQIVHTNYLEDLDCSVDLASNGKEALEKLNNPYDLVFLDMGLPDMTGIEVITEFRKRTLGKKQTPVVSLTGYSSKTEKQEFIQAGTNEVIVKPVFVEQLKNIIHKYCKHEINLQQYEAVVE